MLGWSLPLLVGRRFGRERLASSGGPSRCPPGQSVETAAMRTARHPFEAFPAAGGADVAWIGHCGDGTVEPLARFCAVSVFGLYEARHHQTKAGSGTGESGVFVAPG